MREVKNLNQGWQFVGPDAQTTTVNLPHTWNAVDGQDGGNDYYRGTCVYSRHLTKKDVPAGNVFLEIQGANSSAEVLLNGQSIATHDGGYSTWRVPLEGLTGDDNLEIRVDNAPNDHVYPQMADFTFYGGLYRDVNLIGVDHAHFDLMDHGSSGLYVTPTCENGEWTVNLDARAVNADPFKYHFEILDASGAKVTETETDASVCEFSIANPHLWNGRKDPYLYTARVSIVDGKNVIDSVSARFGLRTYEIDPNKGFILNGESYPLHGVSRHQDWKGIGNALLPEHHKQDIDLICEMGANTVRLAHYQHNQIFYDLCDEKGLVVWAEIPYISRHMENGDANTQSMMEELIRQNYNHASIVVWGLSNEVTMGGAEDPALLANHEKLNELAHHLDPTRKTVVAAISMCKTSASYLRIPDAISYNHYFGWYGGTTDMNGPWFDDFHKKNPTIPIGISEYGCEALNWHSSKPIQGDYTEEYQAYYHEELIKQIAARPYLWATHVWNMFDFGADARAEGGENGQNHKGLVTFDRAYKKDSFYAYKAWLSDEPFVHLCSKRFVDRPEDVTKVKVYSNQPVVELFANGKSLGKKSGQWFFEFDVPNVGETKLEAKAGTSKKALTDESIIRKVDEPNESYTFKESGAILNWFDITAPEGYFNVNDSLGDIMKTFRGLLVILSLSSKLKGGGKKKDGQNTEEGKNAKDALKSKSAGVEISMKDTMKMVQGFSFLRILNLMGTMMGGSITKEDALALNKKLNKIKKPKKK